jgi:tetratricopeptide (TPR) repeat protein
MSGVFGIRSAAKRALHSLAILIVGLALCTPRIRAAQNSSDPIAVALEAARRTHDETQLHAVATQVQQKIAANAADAMNYFLLAQVHSYLLDVYEWRKDKKNAGATMDKAIEAAQHSIQLNATSADAHSLLADLYGRKIGMGGMFAGPKFGPKVGEENKKAMALDDKNPRVWASQGRQYLMAPKMFGGDIAKAIESFQKSLTLDSARDETWVWLAKAYQKQSDKTKALDAVQHALQLNPQNQLAKTTLSELHE